MGASADGGFPDLDYGVLHDLTGHLLRHAFNRGHAAFAQTFNGQGITVLQFMIMEVVTRNPGVSHSQICAAMGTAPSVISTTLKPLLEAGHVSGTRGQPDARRTTYRATDDGAAWFGRLRPQIRNCEDLLTSGLTSEERAELNRMLRVIAGMERPAGP